MADTKLHVVLGKGGVGKSTVAAALAIAATRAPDPRVLAIELDAPGGLSRALGVAPGEPGAVVIAPSGVAVMVIDGAAALAEFLRRKVRLGALLGPVLAHPLYQAFVDAAPGVKELLAIGKVQDEVRLSKRWDTVVVDAGASGHALELLRMPSAAAATFRSGRVHREARHVHAMLADRDHTAIHVVATAEEMPVAEAIDTLTRLRRDLELPIGSVIVNSCIPPAPPGIEATLAGFKALAVEAIDQPIHAGILMSARRGIGWSRLQERQIARLVANTGLVPLRLPRLTGKSIDLERLAALLEPEVRQ